MSSTTAAPGARPVKPFDPIAEAIADVEGLAEVDSIPAPFAHAFPAAEEPSSASR